MSNSVNDIIISSKSDFDQIQNESVSPNSSVNLLGNSENDNSNIIDIKDQHRTATRPIIGLIGSTNSTNLVININQSNESLRDRSISPKSEPGNITERASEKTKSLRTVLRTSDTGGSESTNCLKKNGSMICVKKQHIEPDSEPSTSTNTFRQIEKAHHQLQLINNLQQIENEKTSSSTNNNLGGNFVHHTLSSKVVESKKDQEGQLCYKDHVVVTKKYPEKNISSDRVPDPLSGNKKGVGLKLGPLDSSLPFSFPQLASAIAHYNQANNNISPGQHDQIHKNIEDMDFQNLDKVIFDVGNHRYRINSDIFYQRDGSNNNYMGPIQILGPSMSRNLNNNRPVGTIISTQGI